MVYGYSFIKNTKEGEKKEKGKEKKMASCPVCVEKFNRSTRKPISCIQCSYKACRECYCRYLLSTINDAHCMDCRTRWPMSWLYKFFTQKFIRQIWMPYHVQCIIDHEKNFIPMMMPYIQAQKEYSSLEYENDILRDMKISFQNLYSLAPEKYQSVFDQINQIFEKNKRRITHARQNFWNYPLLLKKHVDAHNYTFPRDQEPHMFQYLKNQVMQRFQPDSKANMDVDNDEFKYYIWPCIHNDCKGFVHEKSYKCGVCNLYTCLRCYQPLPEHYSNDGEVDQNKLSAVHRCKPEDVKSRQNILKETVPCPKCHVPIFRVSGCNQMWCTQCFTPFDYETRKIIEHGAIHNPHYFEHLFQEHKQDRTVLQHNPCQLDIDKIHQILNQLGIQPILHWLEIQVKINEAHDYIRQYRERIEGFPRFWKTWSFLRYKYAIGDISMEEWMSYIKNDEYERNLYSDMIPILGTWIQVVQDYLRDIQDAGQDGITPQNRDSIYKRVREDLFCIVKIMGMFWRNVRIIFTQYGKSHFNPFRPLFDRRVMLPSNLVRSYCYYGHHIKTKILSYYGEKMFKLYITAHNLRLSLDNIDTLVENVIQTIDHS